MKLNILLLLAMIMMWQVDGYASPKTATLRIHTKQNIHDFYVEVAVTKEQRARGLMFQEHLVDNAGMLFDYGQEQVVSMWMKNTLIPLDMLFIRSDGTVAHIVERATPKSLTSHTSPVSVRYVLEVVGGTSERLKIAVGDKVKGLR